MTSVGTPAFWALFAALVAMMLALDLGVFHRKAHVVTAREAAIWTAVWIALALAFGGVVAWRFGSEAGETYLTGYLLEKALSVDNLFVFYMIFAAFRVEDQHQHRLLFWGIIGALALRTGMVFGGAWLLGHFHALAYLFGAILVVTGVRMLGRRDHAPAPERGRLFRLLQRLLPTSAQPHRGRLLVRESGALMATTLMLVLIFIELSDVVFAVDSLLAIFAVTTDPFIVLTSNVFALMGMRSLYFLLAGLGRRFVYLQPGLALVLIFVGVKMAIAGVLHIPIAASLATVAALIGGSIVASLIAERRARVAAQGASGPTSAGVSTRLIAGSAESCSAPTSTRALGE
jgi:tellurite resistance protein TerC